MRDSGRTRGRVFVSYVREDSSRVDRLQQVLEDAGLRTWRDTARLWPGQDWRAQIRSAIADDALVFLACFSQAGGSRTTSYQNEELTQAIDQLRLRPADSSWLIPVRFDDCPVPDRDLGGGRTLRSLQHVDLFGSHCDQNADRLVTAIRQLLGYPVWHPPGYSGRASSRHASDRVSLPLSRQAGEPDDDGAPGAGLPDISVRRDSLGQPGLAHGRPRVRFAPSQCVRTLRAHSNYVYGAAFNPDGTRLATASLDTTTRIWDPVAGICLRTLRGHDGPKGYANNVAFSPDGTLLATAADRTGRVWDPAAGNCLRILHGHTQPVLGVSFSPDGALLATTSLDKTARIWDRATGTCLRALTGHTDTVFGAAFGQDGLLATASADKTVRLWDPATGTCLHTLIGHADVIPAVAFSPDGTLATTSRDSTIRLWNPATGTCLRVLTGHTGAVYGVTFDPQGAFLVTAGRDNTVRLWDPATGALLRTLTGHTDAVHGVALRPDGSLLATTSRDATVRLWE